MKVLCIGTLQVIPKGKHFVLTLTLLRPLKGRVKICSRSIFFDPQDELLPIFKYDFTHITQLESSPPDRFTVHCTRYMETRANSIVGPYKFNEVCSDSSNTDSKQGNFVHHYTLNYVSLTDFMDRVRRLEQIAKLPRYPLASFILT